MATPIRCIHFFLLLFLLYAFCNRVISGKGKESKQTDEKWKKKDIRDYTDADLERLYDQWEEQDEPLEEDELPEWKRPQPKIDLSELDPNDPEKMLFMTKKGRTLMIFATVSGNPDEKETEQITALWQSSLFNANYELQRYIVGSNRVLLMLKDGSKAWEIKDYLVQQDRCEVVTIEGKDYYGKGSALYEGSVEDNRTRKKKQIPKKTQTKKNDIKSEL